MRRVSLLCLVFTGVFNVYSQQICKVVFPVSKQINLDTAVVLWNTVEVYGYEYTKSTLLQRNVDYKPTQDYKGIEFLRNLQFDSMRICYKNVPTILTQRRYNRLPQLVDANSKNPNHSEIELLPTSENVQTEGVLLRGLSFGNAQDIVLNSSLNLRMSGNISKKISLEAAVTDQEFPFQPEGTTSTLQDFDRIYVKLSMPKTSIMLGDYAFQNLQEAKFLKYSKRNRGLQIFGVDSTLGGLLSWEGSAALSRGRFARNEINGIEGLQGPYRLTGTKGEQFVIVVSGTEAVYLDGVKMQRGLQDDYIVDYNSGEITFTTSHIITAFSRIVIEFQYTDRAYTRTVAGGYVGLQKRKSNVYATVFTEQDAKNQPIQQDLDLFDSSRMLSVREILQQSGDEVQNAVISGAKQLDGFNNSAPNYVLIDSAGATWFRYTALKDTFTKFYSVNFSYVGLGNGKYALQGASANGKVYKYVGFVGGAPAGDYEPILQVQAASRLTMAETGGKLQIGGHTLVEASIAMSGNDKNTFSALGDADNKGYAGHINVSDVRPIYKRDSASKWFVKQELQAEYTSASFATVERYRSVEFSRQWDRSLYNAANGTDVSGSRFVTYQVEAGRENGLSMYGKTGYNTAMFGTGKTHSGGLKWKHKGWLLNPFIEKGLNTSGRIKNEFDHTGLSAVYANKYINLAITGDQEKSNVTDSASGPLSTSFGYRQANVKATFDKKSRVSITGNFRRQASGIQYSAMNQIQTFSAGAEFQSKLYGKGFLKAGLNYRSLEVLDTSIVGFANEKHVAGRLEMNVTKLLKWISGNLFYQSISGREQQRQFSYFEVPSGQGFYTWIDFNDNGIKEINEFQETPFKDQAMYVRLLVPTGNYISSQGTEFNGSLQVLPKFNNWKHKLLNRTSWNYNGKSIDENGLKRIMPFLATMTNSTLLSGIVFLRNQLEFETHNGKLLMQYNLQQRNTKLFFTNGFDFRYNQSHVFFLRSSIGPSFQLRSGFEYKSSKYISEYFLANNFEYRMNAADPTLVFQPGNSFRIALNGKYAIFNNDSISRIAELKEIGLQISKTIKKNGMLELRFSALNAQYLFNTSTPLAYDILQGFSKGNNYRINAEMRVSAGKNIQVLMAYEARKTGDVRLVHIGRAEVRYLF